ncbi:MAG: GNAT family N-acetyltransferase [Actinomycetota bacterium]|nr:GNAT family N-acetyltransferase [Actinomycetota bacterium]
MATPETAHVSGGPTEVRAVASASDLRRFIRYPFARYRRDPHWVPPLLVAEREQFDPGKNPFYEHARVDLFLAHRAGEVVGRVAAIDDDNHNETHGDNLAFFGFFEAEDGEAARVLLARVEEWARGWGRSAVRGPANPSLNHSAGFLIDAFDSDPYVMMPYNPPDYPRYVEEASYRKAKDLYAWLFAREWEVGERVGRLAERVRRRRGGLVVRPVDMRRWDEELARVRALYNRAWEKNWGFVRYTDAEFDKLAREFKLILDPELVALAEVEGELAGMTVLLPDANQVFKKMRGRLLPFGILHFLRRRRTVDQLRLPILGVAPEHRNKGLELVMIHELYERAMAKGYKRCECSWTLEDNRQINRVIEAAGARQYKTYRIYEKEI